MLTGNEFQTLRAENRKARDPKDSNNSNNNKNSISSTVVIVAAAAVYYRLIYCKLLIMNFAYISLIRQLP